MAKVALDLGADMVNDVSSLSDPNMVDVIMENKCPVCIMHMQDYRKICKITQNMAR